MSLWISHISSAIIITVCCFSVTTSLRNVRSSLILKCGNTGELIKFTNVVLDIAKYSNTPVNVSEE